MELYYVLGLWTALQASAWTSPTDHHYKPTQSKVKLINKDLTYRFLWIDHSCQQNFEWHVWISQIEQHIIIMFGIGFSHHTIHVDIGAKWFIRVQFIAVSLK